MGSEIGFTIPARIKVSDEWWDIQQVPFIHHREGDDVAPRNRRDTQSLYGVCRRHISMIQVWRRIRAETKFAIMVHEIIHAACPDMIVTDKVHDQIEDAAWAITDLVVTSLTARKRPGRTRWRERTRKGRTA